MSAADMLRPPINRAMRTLDKSFFRKTIPISAARIFKNQNLSSCRAQLMQNGAIIELERYMPIISDPDQDLAKLGKKCILLRSDIRHDDASTWGQVVTDMVTTETAAIIPHTIVLDYDYWSYSDIMAAILPADTHDELPSGFQVVGHVAHLNLRDVYMPYKSLIATVLIDKNPTITTVINKIDRVGEESAFRTFQYEVLGGPDDMDVVVKEQGCLFKFNYAKVYWNSRLHTEHERLVDSFMEGEAICDVMAGIGPFAIPAGRKKCFVYANDLNPESHAALVSGIKLNKVDEFVRPFNSDGNTFIETATKALQQATHEVTIKGKHARTESKKMSTPDRTIVQPKLFSHFVMNLPASALTFLPSFVGLYTKAAITEGTALPKIHVYCFSTKSDDNKEEELKICEEISRYLDFKFKPGRKEVEGEVEIFDVRDVAPKKRMFCAEFTLPAEVAHRKVVASETSFVM